MKKEKVIEIQKSWNRQIEHQLKNVIRDYEKEGYKIIFKEVKKI